MATASITLSRPPAPSGSIETRQTESDGFNYPTFKLVNNQSRLTISPNPLKLNPSSTFSLLAVSNVRGWFAAATSSDSGSALALSSLSDLRTAIKNAQSPFTPSRTLQCPENVTHVSFSSNDSRLLVGLEGGNVLIYDSSAILSPGGNVDPMATLPSSTPLRSIVPNPSTEAGLVDLIAFARADGTAVVVNGQLESQVHFTFSEPAFAVSAVSWSPKGKQIAVGTRSGDLFTFTVPNPSNYQRHIPASGPGVLASLDWLGPGHTFRTTYSPQRDASGEQMGDPVQHIVSFDPRSSSTVFYETMHPYANTDRPLQNSYAAVLPHFDEDLASDPANKSLLIVADPCSIDLEILATDGSNWYQQSQENPLSLPLQKDSEDDTIPVFLGVDLTDTGNSPVMIVYLNDGTIQAWSVNHSKPYPGMVNPAPASTSAFIASPAVEAPSQSTNDNVTETKSAFGASSPATSAFGQSSTGSAFGQSTSQTASPFGQPSAFGQAPVFGQSAFGQKAASPFGGSSSSAFGTPSQPTSAFGQSASNASGFGAFANKSPSAFGQTGFGFAQSAQSSATPTSPAPASQEQSMDTANSTGFGGLSLGGQPSDSVNSKPGIFGNTPQTSSTSTDSGGPFKPASGAFGAGAFGQSPPTSAFGPAHSAIKPGQSAFGAASSGGAFSAFGKPAEEFKPTVFSSPAPPAMSSPFGKTSTGPTFGQSSFGSKPAQPAFGQSGFGQSAFGAKPASTPTSGGFGAFASKGPSGFASPPPADQKPSSGGFSGFSSSGSSAFGGAQIKQEEKSPDSKPSGSGFSAFSSGGPSAFAATQTKKEENTINGGGGGGFSAFSSGAPSAFGTTPIKQEEKEDKTMLTEDSTSSSAPGESITPKKEEKPLGFGAFSSGGPSAFGSQTQPSSPSSFGGLSSGQPSAFGLTTPTTPNQKSTVTPSSPFGGTQGSAFSPPPHASTQSSFGVKSSPFGRTLSNPSADDSPPPAERKTLVPDSPPSSPEASDAPIFTPSTTPSKPATASFLKPGSGAFGSSTSLSTPSTSSSFFGKAPSDDKKVSAFALSGSSGPSFSTATPTSATATPTFGAPSQLGASMKSAFVPTSPSPTPALSTPVSGGFGAFSNKGSSFGTPTPGKSFSTILKEDAKSTEASVPIFNPLTAQEGSVSGKEVSPSSEEEPRKTDEQARPVTPPTPSDEKSKSTTSLPKELNGSTNKVDKEPSFGSLDSQSSSFVDVSAEDASSQPDDSGSEVDDGEELEEDEEEDEAEEEEEETPDEGDENFLSDGLSEIEEEDEDDLEEVTGDQPEPEPAAVPLPASRSASATPRPNETPVRRSTSPSKELSPKSPSTRAQSTTPPGSPAKGPVKLDVAVKAPVPLAASSGLSLGTPRPASTRPLKSSPLAGVAVSSDAADEDELQDNEPADLNNTGKASRPKTPPLLSGSSKGPVHPPRNAASTSPTASILPGQSPSSFFGKPTTPTSVFTPIKPESPGLFGLGNNPLTSGIFGGASKTATPPPSTVSQPSPSIFKSATPPESQAKLPAFGSFAQPTPGFLSFNESSRPSPSVMGKPAPPPAKSSIVSPFGSKGSLFGTLSSTPASSSLVNQVAASEAISAVQTKPIAATPLSSAPVKQPSNNELPLEEGMQRECAALILQMDRELDSFKADGARVQKLLEDYQRPLGGSRNPIELAISSKWAVSDAPLFRTTLLTVEADLEGLDRMKRGFNEDIRKLKGLMLKASTRKEEIARFTKARSDAEINRMIKSRTLGPEYLESQTQLRRDIRNIQSRLQHLEAHLASSKKKLSEVQSGKVALKAPTLDRINRTYRNISRALAQQDEELDRLKRRVSKLDLGLVLGRSKARSSKAHGARDPRLPDRPPVSVSAHVAMSTAAALNAERSAQKLKQALLSIRTTPLLNRKVLTAGPAPREAFNTPKKTSEPFKPLAFNTPPGMSLFSQPPSTSPSLPEFSLPSGDDQFQPTPLLPRGRRGAGVTGRMHDQGVKMPSKPATPNQNTDSTSNSTSSFWGPVPVFTPPKKTDGQFVSFTKQ